MFKSKYSNQYLDLNIESVNIKALNNTNEKS